MLINKAHECREDISERTKGAIAAPPLQPRSINLTPVLEQAMRAPAAVSREHRPKTHNKPDQSAGRQLSKTWGSKPGTASLDPDWRQPRPLTPVTDATKAGHAHSPDRTTSSISNSDSSEGVFIPVPKIGYRRGAGNTDTA